MKTNSEQKPLERALKLKGLANTASKKDVIQFFGERNIIVKSVKIGTMADSRRTGEAVVMFKNPKAA